VHLPEAPPELDALLAACLARRAEDRPQSMASLLPVLHRMVTSGPRMWPLWLDPGRAGDGCLFRQAG
jgi:hypothetical protein